jgi:hypothetical protein
MRLPDAERALVGFACLAAGLTFVVALFFVVARFFAVTFIGSVVGRAFFIDPRRRGRAIKYGRGLCLEKRT